MEKSMEKIQNNLLNDTYNLVQLARETARLRGSEQQAQKLSPVVDQLKNLVKQQHEPVAAEPTGILSQDDFRNLVSLQKNSTNNTIATIKERNQVITAMASGGMKEMDIARQMGMARDEIRMVLNMANSNSRRIA
jgi:ABC-type hemin transport system ATPase subunit